MSLSSIAVLHTYNPTPDVPGRVSVVVSSLYPSPSTVVGSPTVPVLLASSTYVTVEDVSDTPSSGPIYLYLSSNLIL